MLFASFPYILAFLPCAVIVCILLRQLAGPRAAQIWVLAASIFFYTRAGYFNLVYLALSILGNWLLARAINRAEEPAKKRMLVTALVLNTAYLCVFKYLGFLASLVPFLLPHGFAMPEIPFPLGISFFTVTQIMYLVDCYEGSLSHGSLLDHATFVSFFPYVISGPLGRAKRMRHQFGNFGSVDGARAGNLARGLFQFSMGLFKKAVIADSFARISTFGYNSAKNLSCAEAWFFGIAYVFQIYFDFSGYSDMAIGSARMLGIDIPANFDAPYKAKSIIEFWQRWHISLTSFITTYLFTPILLTIKSRRPFKRDLLFASAFATFLAMGIAGLWHGAAWTFVVWGFLHGLYLGINQYWRRKKMPKIPGLLSWAITFAAMTIAEVFFGASSVKQGAMQVASMFNPHHALMHDNISRMGVEGVSFKIFGVPLLIGAIAAFVGPSSEQLAREFRPTIWNCAYGAALLLVGFLFVNSNIPSPFIYFRF
ncbi:MBOAT family O-acyltransferase [Terracidiphilus sp.]|jgi:D-alanyl-lipoteichoic acid acyltransferase DltB (MBOAT superfamily)|uniref:MBOAT family O-acyltransferase n=1 Tax=Terracidiphilus sp. TaxID=1964191 RepID=UPI003C1EC617